MLLKISLIIAILASVGTLVLSHLQLDGKVRNIKEELQATIGDRDAARKDAETAKKDFKKAKEEAEKTAKELAETQSNLEIAMSNWKTQQDRADKFEAAHKQATTELVETSREVSAWRALGIPLDQVRGRLAEADKIKLANEALNEEKKIMVRNIGDLRRRLSMYEEEGKETVPPMQPVKGKVLAVDSKWDFVIIDIGANQGALERGELLISRDGKLVAKVRIARVEPDRSIANVLPEWKQTDINEGDLVLN